MRKMKIALAAVLAAVTLQAPFALADGDQPRRGGPCKEDRDKLCKDAPQGRGGMVRCLRLHESELSDGCKAFLDSHRRRGPAPKPEESN